MMMMMTMMMMPETQQQSIMKETTDKDATQVSAITAVMSTTTTMVPLDDTTSTSTEAPLSRRSLDCLPHVPTRKATPRSSIDSTCYRRQHRRTSSLESTASKEASVVQLLQDDSKVLLNLLYQHSKEIFDEIDTDDEHDDGENNAIAANDEDLNDEDEDDDQVSFCLQRLDFEQPLKDSNTSDEQASLPSLVSFLNDSMNGSTTSTSLWSQANSSYSTQQTNDGSTTTTTSSSSYHDQHLTPLSSTDYTTEKWARTTTTTTASRQATVVVTRTRSIRVPSLPPPPPPASGTPDDTPQIQNRDRKKIVFVAETTPPGGDPDLNGRPSRTVLPPSPQKSILKKKSSSTCDCDLIPLWGGRGKEGGGSTHSTRSHNTITSRTSTSSSRWDPV
jgi:hypothetical protein